LKHLLSSKLHLAGPQRLQRLTLGEIPIVQLQFGWDQAWYSSRPLASFMAATSTILQLAVAIKFIDELAAW
jgi:hypothetical protein